jgi:hypothetical protein
VIRSTIGDCVAARKISPKITGERPIFSASAAAPASIRKRSSNA